MIGFLTYYPVPMGVSMNKNTNLRYVAGFFWVLLLASIISLLVAGYFLVPYLFQAVRQYQSYLNLQWAHESNLVEVLINLILASWAFGSVIFINSWLIHRVWRKLKGKSWAVLNKKNKNSYFPAISTYLKVSVLFLILGWLFVAIQYPLQFM